MRPGDLDAVLATQSESPEAAQWSRAAYERAAQGRDGWIAQVAEAKAAVRGFFVLRHLGEEGEILNLAVTPNARRVGIGSRLLAEALQIVRSQGARRVFLEVRAGNRAAIAFYEHHGFRACGRRPGYYCDPAEDALILALDLV